MIKFFTVFLINSLLFIGLDVDVAYAQGCKYVDKVKLANVMNIDNALIPFLNLEIPNCENIHIADGFAGFVLNEQNEKLNNGIRSEIAIGFPFLEGDTVEYRWSIMIPSKSSPGGQANQWWIIAQWHDQPDPRIGETWATFKPQSPPVAIYIENRQGKTGIGIQGLRGEKISWAPVQTDVWLDLRAVIRWSTGSAGSVRFSVDGHPEFDYEYVGQNMLNSYQHYFKAGQYRAPSVNKYSVIYMRNIRFKKL